MIATVAYVIFSRTIFLDIGVAGHFSALAVIDICTAIPLVLLNFNTIKSILFAKVLTDAAVSIAGH